MASESPSKFFTVADFFAFLIPGLVFMVAISLLLAVGGSSDFTALVKDALPDNAWLQGGAVVLIAYGVGHLLTMAGRGLAGWVFNRRPDPAGGDIGDFRREMEEILRSDMRSYDHEQCLHTITYSDAWVILRDGKDRKSYDHCYYLWSLEAMFSGLAIACMMLGLAFIPYDLTRYTWHGIRLGDVVFFSTFWITAYLFFKRSRDYYRSMLSELARSVIYRSGYDESFSKARNRCGTPSGN